MKPIYFAAPSEWRAWLEKHHRTAAELLVGFYKKETGRPSLTWPQSVDEALCFGWIDGIRRTVDAERYTIRFTPRRQGSTWSLVNIRRVGELKALGQMRPEGLKAFDERHKSASYSYELRRDAKLPPEALKRFKADPRAWKFWQAQPPGYRRLMAYYVIGAKQEATRTRRLEAVIGACVRGERLGQERSTKT